jgi:phosphohistidine swiveling domain-containing protein
VLVVPRVGAFLALEAVAHCALAVISADAIEDDAREILRAGNVPAISGVPALVDRLRGGELLDLDATRGRVRTVV